ncbi:hypothetical protein [Arthrobacter methylotrophus]|uniref:hypothetical protein n=1 Tax=Arthrobacter methylotrophus TaxID=121291 RepID=UPI0031F00ED3
MQFTSRCPICSVRRLTTASGTMPMGVIHSRFVVSSRSRTATTTPLAVALGSVSKEPLPELGRLNLFHYATANLTALVQSSVCLG